MTNAKKPACLVVLSGGQDSTTCAAWAKQRYEHVHAITFDYGQRHRLEIEAALMAAITLDLDSHHVIKVDPGCLLSTSPLTDKEAQLERYRDPREMEATIGDRRELTFVPMRNALFLTIAANRATAMGITTIVLGVCAMDNANYDDCRETFLQAAEQYINRALGHDHRGTEPIALVAPLLFLTKAESVRLAQSLPDCMDALAYSHTCYDGQYPPCGTCHACVLRADGFAQAGVVDPLVARCAAGGA